MLEFDLVDLNYYSNNILPPFNIQIRKHLSRKLKKLVADLYSTSCSKRQVYVALFQEKSFLSALVSKTLYLTHTIAICSILVSVPTFMPREGAEFVSPVQ